MYIVEALHRALYCLPIVSKPSDGLWMSKLRSDSMPIELVYIYKLKCNAWCIVYWRNQIQSEVRLSYYRFKLLKNSPEDILHTHERKILKQIEIHRDGEQEHYIEIYSVSQTTHTHTQ